MRLVLFTDTLHDINGVSRFIRNIGDQAAAAGHDLHIITSTRIPAPPGVAREFTHNVAPRFAFPMPGYPQLELALPRRAGVFQLASRLAPDIVHVSTPGPIGTLGRRFARDRGLPLVGTYHTDFPAYIDNLFDDPVMTWMSRTHMSWFYRRFAALFTRSLDYAASIERLGVPRGRIVRLIPGIDTSAFRRESRDDTGGLWRGLAAAGVREKSVKVLYVGRVSVEKNLPLLTLAWPAAFSACSRAGVDAQLIVVGDGPYLAAMRERFPPGSAAFLGFRHGRELSAIYASSDVFVFPSTTDTLGQVVMESQCAGLPVIVTDQGGPSEVVDDGVTGFVLPATPGATGRWSEAIARLACDTPLRRRMGAAASAKIQPLTIRRSFDHFWSVHEDVLAAHRAPASTPRASHR